MDLCQDEEKAPRIHSRSNPGDDIQADTCILRGHSFCSNDYLINEGDEWDVVPNNSTTVYLIVLQGIALEIASRLGVTLDDFRVNHPGGGIGARLSGKDLW